MRRRVPRVERVAIVGALALAVVLLPVANVLGGWFVSRFWVWAAPVAAVYWGAWRWWASRQDDGDWP